MFPGWLMPGSRLLCPTLRTIEAPKIWGQTPISWVVEIGVCPQIFASPPFVKIILQNLIQTRLA